MKKYVFLISAFVIALMSSCNDSKAVDQISEEKVEQAQKRDEAASSFPEMTFDNLVHDFGDIAQGTAVEHIFTFTNTGKSPLVISNARSSCGCTIPEYTREPIAPGATGELLVKFDGSGRGNVTKTITVATNTERTNETIRIRANVQAK